MRRKIVLWGSNEKDEKILVALELLEKENAVHIYTFPEAVATEAFYKEMSEKWKDDVEIEFPSGFTKIERKLSVSDSILPDEIKVDRPDLISRAQVEWHVVVLSSKLYGMYKSELEELKEKIDNITEYDNLLWDDLKNFWNKVQNQVTDKNLFREHGAALREKTNHLFDKLKEYKKTIEDEFETQSKKYYDTFKEDLNEIEKKIEKGLGLNPIFEDLKKIQHKIKDFKFTKDDRNDLWNQIDATFKKLKDKRGSQAEQQVNNNLARLQARYDGLITAIQKMQKSIDFDQKDLDYQTKKVADSDGQLESQLRQAKIRMIDERIKSKKEKMDDMLKTKAELESKLEKEKKRSEKAEKIEEARQTVKQKIAANITENAKELDKISDKLEKAASEMPKQSKKETGFIDKISESMEQLVEDVVDTAKAIAVVAGEKLDDMMDYNSSIQGESEETQTEKSQSDAVADVASLPDEVISDINENIDNYDNDIGIPGVIAFGMANKDVKPIKYNIEGLWQNKGEIVDNITDTAKDKIMDIIENVKDKTEDVWENAQNIIESKADTAQDKIEEIIEKIQDTIEDIKGDSKKDTPEPEDSTKEE